MAPLRFGAGVKGKVLEAFAAGLPCAMTPVAAEGYALPEALHGLIGADADAFARLVVALHVDPATNQAAGVRRGEAFTGDTARHGATGVPFAEAAASCASAQGGVP